jgi:hypothetical protein
MLRPFVTAALAAIMALVDASPAIGAVATPPPYDLQSIYSPAAASRHVASVAILSVRVRRDLARDFLSVTVRWRAEAEKVTLTGRLRKDGHTIWSKDSTKEFVSFDALRRTSFSWKAPRRLPQGTQLTLEITLAAEGATATTSRTVRSP